MKNDDLTVKKTSNSLNPFEWKSFVSEKRDYNLYRTYLGSKIVILNHTTTAFLKNPDGTIDYKTQINFDDLKLDLKDHGFKITDRDYISILNSDKTKYLKTMIRYFLILLLMVTISEFLYCHAQGSGNKGLVNFPETSEEFRDRAN